MRASVRWILLGAGLAVPGCYLSTDLSGYVTALATPDGGGNDGGLEGGSGSGFERPLSIRNEATRELPAGHAVCFSLAATIAGELVNAAKLRSDLGDLRVFGPSGELPRVVDRRGPGIVVTCFRLARAIAPSATDDGYVLRYGSPEQEPPLPAERDVFVFFDGFDGPLSEAYETRGPPVVEDGVLRLPAGTKEPGISTRAGTDPVPLEASFEIRLCVTNLASTGVNAAGLELRYWFGYYGHGLDGLSGDVGPPYTVFFAENGASLTPIHERTQGLCSDPCSGAARPQTTEFRTYRIDRTAQAVRFVWDDGVAVELQGSNGDESINVRSFLRDGDILIDWMRARPLIAPEPTIMVGEEAPAR